MKKFGLLGLFFLFSGMTLAQKAEVKWLSFEQAIALNKENPKKILVDVYTNWCYYCKVMDKKTYANAKIATYINANFYPVKFNAEQKEDLTFDGEVYKFKDVGRRGYHEFAVAILERKLSYPTTVFFDDKTHVISRLPGYLDARSFKPILVYLAEDFYETKSWDVFIKDYKKRR